MKLPWITDPAELARRKADVAIVGAPFDDAVSHRPGARFGPRAIREAQYTSGSINSLQLDVEPFDVLTVVDAGDANIVPGLDRARPRDDLPQGPRGRRDRRDPDRARRRPLDHVAVGDGRRRGPRARAASASSISTPTPTPRTTTGACSPATARRCAGSSNRARSRAATSCRSACAATGRRSRRSNGCSEQGLRWHFMREIEERGAEAVIAAGDRRGARRPRLRSTLSLDIDVIDPGMAPGTGTPEPGGMLTREVLRAIRQIVGAVELAGMDVVEVSPPYDHAETTAMAANRAALEAISALAVAGATAGHVRWDRPRTRRALAGGCSTGLTPPRPRRSRGCTTSTSRTIRATSTCTSRWPTGPTGRSSSSAAGKRPAGGPARPRPATRSRPSTSTPRCSTARARPRDRAPSLPADRLELRRGRPARSRASPTPGATRSRSSPSTRSCCSPPATPSGPRSGRSPRTSPRAGSPSSTHGCRMPRTSAGSTAGSSSSGSATDPETGRGRHEDRLGPARRRDRDRRA